jgi:type I restriction enzyme S subunit
VGLEHVDPEDLRIRRWGLVAEGTTFTNLFKPGQVLFGKRRAYQRKVAVADFEGVCSGDIYVFESKDAGVLLPDLLPFICQTDGFFDHAVGTSAGSLSPRTNWTQLAQYEFALPPLDEQRRLVNALLTASEVSESYEVTLNAAEILLAVTRESLFSNLNSKCLRLGDVLVRIEAGKSVVGYNETPQGDAKGVLKVSAVGAQGFRPEEVKALVDDRDFLPQYQVRAGDLLISRANTYELVGLVCLVERDYNNYMLSDKTLRMVPKPEYSTQLLNEALKTQAVRAQIRSLATGTGAAMKNISQQKIESLIIRLPSEKQEQELVLQQLGQLQKAIDAIRSRAKRSKLVTNLLLEHY